MIDAEIEVFKEYVSSSRDYEFGAIVRVSKRELDWMRNWADRERLVMALARAIDSLIHDPSLVPAGGEARIYRLTHDDLFREPC